MSKNGDRSALAVLGLVALPLLCCGLPALAAAGALAATGGWLTAHGFWLGGGIALAAAAGVGARWWAQRGRCELAAPSGAPLVVNESMVEQAMGPRADGRDRR